MKRFENTVEKLKTDQYAAITVLEMPSLAKLAYNMTGQQMTEQFGSVEGFFNDLNQKGVKSLKVYDRRKNGSTYKIVGEPYDFDMVSNSETVEPQPQAAPVQNIPAQQPMGLMGGLNAADIYRVMDHPKLETKVQILEKENSELRSKVEGLKEKALEDKFSETKASGNNELILGLAGHFGPALMAAVTKTATPGLVAAERVFGMTGAENLSETHQTVLEIVRNVPDTMAYYIGKTAENISNVPFQTELIALLGKYPDSL